MHTDIGEFQEWLKTVEPHDLWRWLSNAYWHGGLKGTELERAYLLSQNGVDMRTIPVELKK